MEDQVSGFDLPRSATRGSAFVRRGRGLAVAGSKQASSSAAKGMPKRTGARKDRAPEAGVTEKCQDGAMKDMVGGSPHSNHSDSLPLWGVMGINQSLKAGCVMVHPIRFELSPEKGAGSRLVRQKSNRCGPCLRNRARLLGRGHFQLPIFYNESWDS